MKKKGFKRVTGYLAGLLILFCLLSCGYKFSGKEKVAGKITALKVLTFDNLTIETRISPIITNDLINEFSRGGITVLNSFGGDDKPSPVVAGVIKLVKTETVSRVNISSSNERRIKITVDVKVTNAKGETLRSFKDISEQEDYKVYDEKQDSEKAKSGAIKILSERLAEKIYLMFTEDF